MVDSFSEKTAGDGAWINGGYFVLEPSVIDRIDGDSTVWEQAPLRSLAHDGQLAGLQARRVLAADGHPARQAVARVAVGGGRGAVEGLVTG